MSEETKEGLFRRARKATRDHYRKLFRKSRVKSSKVSRHPEAGHFRAPSKTTYYRYPNGMIIRTSPKPYQMKKQAKLYKQINRKPKDP